MSQPSDQYAQRMSQLGTPEQHAPDREPSPRRTLWPWIVAGVVLLVIVATAIIVPITIAQHATDEKTKAEAVAEAKAEAAEKARLAQFSTALKSCNINAKNVVIRDSGESIELTRVTKYDGMAYSELTCFLAGLDAPDSIEAKIGQTRA